MCSSKVIVIIKFSQSTTFRAINLREKKSLSFISQKGMDKSIRKSWIETYLMFALIILIFRFQSLVCYSHNKHKGYEGESGI